MNKRTQECIKAIITLVGGFALLLLLMYAIGHAILWILVLGATIKGVFK